MQMKPIRIEQVGERIALTSPYHEDLPAKAKALAGRFERATESWFFAACDLEHVRVMCRDIWGADDTDAGDATVRLRCIKGVRQERKGITLRGVPIARAFGRDTDAKLEQDVVFLVGAPYSGGSRANWCTTLADGAVFELRHLPAGTAARIRAWCQPDNPKTSYHVVDDDAAAAHADRLALLGAERDRLVTRLREIEAEMAANK
jgi:hypothetical protein